MQNLLITTFAESSQIAEQSDYIEKAVWSSLGFLNFSDPFIHYFDLMERYPDYQVALIDQDRDCVIATGNLIPLRSSDPAFLAEGGWDWALEQAASSIEDVPNMTVGLSVSVPHAYRGQGLARIVLGAMRNLSEAKGLGLPLMPVRPTRREHHLDIDIVDYARWRRADGKLYDPWLRSHEGVGGRMLGICRESMVIRKPVNFWEAWSGQRFEASGEYPIAGGLAPVRIDLDRGIGTYVEPNVWYQ